MDRAVAFVLKVIREQDLKIRQKRCLTMGVNGKTARLGDAQSDRRARLGLGRQIGRLPPFQRFVQSANCRGLCGGFKPYFCLSLIFAKILGFKLDYSL